ncbi:unnamed protein product, partial [Mesorhabditis belari]|uniref:Protein quiver n=1 Tax=Mesorhabditis belari TaxID=2138241 RepID=A0AAF3J771_9BILA
MHFLPFRLKNFLILALFAFPILALECYHCDSLNDGDCQEDQVRHEHLKECNPLTFGPYYERVPIGCRKMIDKAPYRITRTCSYMGRRVHGRRANNKLVYQCAESRCNSSKSQQNLLFIFIFFILFPFLNFLK